MRISTTVLGLLLGSALAAGMAIGHTSLPTTGSIRTAVSTEDTRDGGLLTDAMIEEIATTHPTTDPATCRWHPLTDLALVITCDDGTYEVWS